MSLAAVVRSWLVRAKLTASPVVQLKMSPPTKQAVLLKARLCLGTHYTQLGQPPPCVTSAFYRAGSICTHFRRQHPEIRTKRDVKNLDNHLLHALLILFTLRDVEIGVDGASIDYDPAYLVCATRNVFKLLVSANQSTSALSHMADLLRQSVAPVARLEIDVSRVAQGGEVKVSRSSV